MSIDNISPDQWDSINYVQTKEDKMPTLETKVEGHTPEDVDNLPCRYNEGKPDVSLVPSEFILASARAMTYGAKKYKAGNYLLADGMPVTTVYASMMRHLLAWHEGELYDDESGLLHTDHIAANLAMLIELEKRGLGRNA